MRSRSIRWASILIIIIVVVLAVIGNTGKRTVAIMPQPGYQAPPIRLASFAGPTLSLVQFRGKPVFVNFWASWCPPCRAETPDLVKMYRKFGGNIVFLGVNLTDSDSVLAAKGFIQYYRIPYPVLEDAKNAVGKEYDIIAIPTSFFINREGIIVSRVTGGMTSSVMQRNFSALLTKS